MANGSERPPDGHKPQKPTEEFLTDEEYEMVEKLLSKILNTPFNIPMVANVGVERVHDDHEGTYKGSIQLVMSSDGDMWIKTTPPELGSGMLRYRGLNGGSMSPRVHNALRILAYAIILDNQARPVRRESD